MESYPSVKFDCTGFVSNCVIELDVIVNIMLTLHWRSSFFSGFCFKAFLWQLSLQKHALPISYHPGFAFYLHCNLFMKYRSIKSFVLRTLVIYEIYTILCQFNSTTELIF